MMYCKKLEVKIPKLDMSKILGGSERESYPDLKSWYINDLDYLISQLTSTIKFTLLPDAISYTEIYENGAEPHLEPLKTVLNYYIETNKSVTFFWKKKSENIHGVKMPIMQGEHVDTFRYEDLEYQTSFMAKPEDVWLISTNSIHSVSKPVNKEIRKFIRIGWYNYTVEEVYDSIRIL